MKPFLFACAILACFCVPQVQAAPGDSPISGLTESTNLTSDDLLVIVDDPNGSPATKKITAANLSAGVVNIVGINNLLAITNHESRAVSVSNTWVFSPTTAARTTIVGGIVSASSILLAPVVIATTAMQLSALNANQLIYSGPAGYISNIVSGGSNTVLIGSSPPSFVNISTLVNTNAASTVTNVASFSYTTNITELKFNILGFGATGDGLIATNCSVVAGSQDVTVSGTAPTSAHIGKVFSLYGAGTNGQNLTTIITNVVGSIITLSNPAIATVTGNSAVYGSDDTAAIQAAMNYVATNGGGTILFPSGIYIVNGALQDTGTNRLHHNAQLYFPDVPQRGNLAPTVLFQGVMPIPWPRGLSGVRSNEFASYGATLWSTLSGGPNVNPGRTIDCRNFNTPAAVGYCDASIEILPLNNITVAVKNMIWRAAFDNNLTLMDLQGADGSVLEECFVDTGWHQGNQIPAITHTNTWGVKTSGSFNENMSYVNNLMVRGFYWGLDLGENSTAPNIHVEGCIHGLCNSGLSGTAGKWVGHANIQECSNAVSFGACATMLNIAQLNIYSYERYTNTLNLVFDPNNSWYGSVSYSFNGADNDFTTPTNGLTAIGATHVKISRTGLSFFPMQSESTIVSAAQESLYFRRIYGYGDPFPSVNWGTNALAFADAFRYAMYLNGSLDQLQIDHIGGSTPFKIDGSQGVSIGVSGKTLTIPATTASTMLRVDGSKIVQPVTVGTGLTFDGTTLAATGSGALTNDVYWKTNNSTGITNTGGNVTVNGGYVSVTNKSFLFSDGTFSLSSGLLQGSSSAVSINSGGGATSQHVFQNDGQAFLGGSATTYKLKLDASGVVTVTNLQGAAAGFVGATTAGVLQRQTDASSLTNYATTNLVNTYKTFPSATNALAVNNDYHLLTVGTDCSVTNITGGVAGQVRWASLQVSNSAASAIVLRMTGNASIRPMGVQTTNGLSIAAGKTAIFSALCYGTSITNYCTAVQQ